VERELARLTRAGDLPVRSDGLLRLALLLVVVQEALAHGVAELEGRERAAELGDLVVAESELQIHTALELLQVVVRQAPRPPHPANLRGAGPGQGPLLAGHHHGPRRPPRPRRLGTPLQPAPHVLRLLGLCYGLLGHDVVLGAAALAVAAPERVRRRRRRVEGRRRAGRGGGGGRRGGGLLAVGVGAPHHRARRRLLLSGWSRSLSVERGGYASCSAFALLWLLLCRRQREKGGVHKYATRWRVRDGWVARGPRGGGGGWSERGGGVSKLSNSVQLWLFS
jgi:hypothetical protein